MRAEEFQCCNPSIDRHIQQRLQYIYLILLYIHPKGNRKCSKERKGKKDYTKVKGLHFLEEKKNSMDMLLPVNLFSFLKTIDIFLWETRCK